MGAFIESLPKELLNACKVAPRVGAFIETMLNVMLTAVAPCVRLLKGGLKRFVAGIDVAPRLGAFIGIIWLRTTPAKAKVAPRVGAFIERSSS